jgi:hypothetical protein
MERVSNEDEENTILCALESGFGVAVLQALRVHPTNEPGGTWTGWSGAWKVYIIIFTRYSHTQHCRLASSQKKNISNKVHEHNCYIIKHDDLSSILVHISTYNIL